MGASSTPRPPRRALIDTNVALDFLLRREPWLTEAAGLIAAHADGSVVGYMPASTITDIFSISRRIVGAEKAFETIDLCLDAFEILAIDRAISDIARSLSGADFADNVQIACAIVHQLDCIITRDMRGFAHAPMPVLTPKAFGDQAQ